MATSKGYRLLVITDHRIHSPVESIYAIARTLASHEACDSVDVVSRGVPANSDFFERTTSSRITVTRVDEGFAHSPEGFAYTEKQFEASVNDYDVAFLRMPRVSSMDFFARIPKLFPAERLINQPAGIASTGSKEYLLNFPQVCPPIALCKTLRDVEAFKARFPIVLKPLNNSGGKGLVRIEGDLVHVGQKIQTWDESLPQIESELKKGYLGMKFLKNVHQGDKRVIVVNGEVVASALRIPTEGSWLCNVSMGASSVAAEPDEAEMEIAALVAPDLLQKGVVMFGFDTLMGDDGKRVLSELNTSCVNGIFPAELASGKPVVKNTCNLLWKYILDNIRNIN